MRALSLCAAAALCAAATRTAGAQRAATLERVHPVALSDAPTHAPEVRPILTYRFTGWRGADLPSEVTIVDSAGTFVASYRTARTNAARPLSVVVDGADIYVSGTTEAGPLTLELHDPIAASTGTEMRGRWTVGEQSGDLRGRVTRVARQD